MSYKNFDYKKSLNIQNKRRKSFVKKAATIAATTLILTLPVNTAINHLNVPGFEQHIASAASLAEVQLLSDVAITADLNQETYDLALGMTGTGLADVELITPDRVGVFYIPELAGKMQADGQAQVRVEILPITMDDLPALNTAVGALTGTATDLVGGVVSALDTILGNNPLLKPLVSIEGLDGVSTAIDNLNNLDQALTDLLAYEGEANVIVNPDGSVVVDFSEGLGQHLDTTVNEVVTELVNDLLNAVGGLEIKVLPGVSAIPVVGPILNGIVNDLILGGIVSGLLEGLTDGLQPVVAGVTGATTDITNQLAGVQVIGETTIDLNVKVDRPARVNGDVAVYGAGVNTSVIDLTLLSSLIDQGEITFEETVLELDAPIVEEAFDGDVVVTGIGESGATVEVKDADDNVIGTGLVDPEGNFTVTVETPLVEGQEVEVTQKSEAKRS